MKANAASGTTCYVAEGAPVPTDVHPDVRLVGPGALPPDAEQPDEQPAPKAEPKAEPKRSGGKS